jgi:hypothetical protein
MRRGTRSIAVVAAVVAAVTTGAPSASATPDRSTQTRLALQRVGVSPGSAGVALPERGDTVRAGDLTISYPRAASSSRALDAHTRVFDGRHFDQVVQSTGPDDVRLLTVLTDRSAPTTYDYSFAGHELHALDDGSVAVLDEQTGEPVALIEPAWAKDADGAPVATRYEINGSTLTQVVDVADDTAFPVVADPSVKWHWWGIDILLSKTETLAMASSLGGCAAILSKVPYLGTSCRVLTVWAASGVTYHKCLALKKTWTSLPVPWYWSCRW